jgi:hypothetical protein
MMQVSTVVLMGIPIKIRYQFHEGNYLEWRLTLAIAHQDITHPHTELLELLLRTSHSSYIEATLRELTHHQSYAEQAAMAHRSDDNEPF